MQRRPALATDRPTIDVDSYALGEPLITGIDREPYRPCGRFAR